MSYSVKALALGALFVPMVAVAAWPAGQYTASFRSETGGGIATQGICIVSDGTWYGTTFSAWAGKWYAKGNDLHLHGNYSAGAGNDAFELTREPTSSSTGYWQEWTDGGTFDNYLRVRFAFKGNTCDAPAFESSISTDANPSD